MKKLFKTSIAILLAVGTFTAVSCKGNNGDNGDGKTENATYTYHETMGSTPAEWNPHSLQSSGSYAVNLYATMGWVSVGMKENGEFTWLYEMADSIEDITVEYAQKEKYGIGVSETNRVWEIKLNEAATWENGEKINADTYIYSMQQMLDYDMKNYRSSVYTEGVAAIYNAKEYMYSGQNYYGFLEATSATEMKDDGLYLATSEPVFYSLNETIGALGMSLTELYEIKPEKFDYNGEKLYDALNLTANADGYVRVTAQTQPLLEKLAENLGGAALWRVICCYQKPFSAEWSDVGFYKLDEYTLHYITAEEVEKTDIFSQFTTNFLVYQPLYEAGKKTVEGLTATDYGTSVNTYISYGPYKLVSIEKDKQIVLTKNEAWYGYKDGKHEGMYQTTDIKFEVVSSHETELQLFLKGDLERSTLFAADMKTYKYSDQILRADETFVFSICMNTDLEELKALETQAGGNVNKRVGAYKTFREALSYAIDRSNFVAEGTAGSKVQFGLFNDLYYYDINNDMNSVYRKSEQGMRAIVEHYGLEYGEGKEYSSLQAAYASITGYDVNKAKALFQETYLQMKADENYTDGQAIKLNCVCSQQATLSEEKISQQNLLNSYIQEATKGTGFEGKITVTFTNSKTMYSDFRDGLVEMIVTEKSGAENSPYYQISKYVNGNQFTVPELAAYDPSTETMTLTIGGEAITKTIRQWSNSINSGGDYVNAVNATKLHILSSIEQYLLDSYINIPLYSRCQVYLNSKKINQGSEKYNPYYGFGGIAYITYNYDDAAWAKYVKEQGGTLSYE